MSIAAMVSSIMLRSVIVSSCLIALGVAACGGSTSSIPEGTSGGTSGSSGASSGSTSSGTSGASSGASSSGGTNCVPNIINGDRACVPGTAKANEAIEIEIDATEGCLGCFTKLDGCNASVSGNVVTVQMKGTTCTPPGDVACPAVCGRASTKCKLPPMASGTYTVKVTGENANASPRVLVVSDSTKVGPPKNSCSLPEQGRTPPPLDGSKYSKSCSVPTDCKAVSAGNLCATCYPCPTVAISKSSADQYESDVRAATSLCPNRNGGPACGACQQPKVDCEIDPTALTGTCKILPF